MRKGLVLFVLFIATLSACQKSSNSSNQPTTYKVNNITDAVIAFDTGATTSLYYTVNYLGPIQETVILSLENLPSGLYIDTTTNAVSTGIPNFNGGFVVKNSGTAKSGKYPVTLVCTGSVTGRKTYAFNIKVLLPTVCTSGITGGWSNSTVLCFGTNYVDSVKLDATTLNRVHFTNFEDSALNIYADLYCRASTFTIPLQQAGVHYFWGHGSFSGTNISINFTDSIDGVSVTNCGTYMLR